MTAKSEGPLGMLTTVLLHARPSNFRTDHRNHHLQFTTHRISNKLNLSIMRQCSPSGQLILLTHVKQQLVQNNCTSTKMSKGMEPRIPRTDSFCSFLTIWRTWRPACSRRRYGRPSRPNPGTMTRRWSLAEGPGLCPP